VAGVRLDNNTGLQHKANEDGSWTRKISNNTTKMMKFTEKLAKLWLECDSTTTQQAQQSERRY
jgi:hypothetical protein